MVEFVRKATKASLLTMLRKAKEITPQLLARLFEGVMFKDEYDTASGGGGTFLRQDGTTPLTANWDAGSYEIRAQTLESDVATGTAPLTVASTTLVDNLNADTVDGVEESAFLLADGTRELTNSWDVGGSYSITNVKEVSAEGLTASGDVVTDIIGEYSVGAGVTIDGVLHRDGSIADTIGTGTFEFYSGSVDTDFEVGNDVNVAGDLYVDEIYEYNTDAGVTIDSSVLIKDEILSITGTTPQIGVGTTTPESPIQLHFVGDGNVAAQYLESYGVNSQLIGRVAGGTLASPAQAGANVLLLGLSGRAYHDNSDWTASLASVELRTSAVAAQANAPSHIRFYTTPSGSASRAEVARITEAGALQVNTINEQTAAAGVTIDSVLVKDNSVRCGDATNNITIESDYGVTLNGTSTVWDDLRVSINAVRVIAGGAPPDWEQFQDNGAGSTGVYLYWFDPGTQQNAYFTVQLPHNYKQGTDIEPHVHWVSKDTAGSAGTDVCWGLEYTWSNINGTFGNTTIIYGDTQSNGSGETLTQYKHYYTDLGSIDGTGATISSMLVCRIFRDAAGVGGTDDYDDDAGLLEIDFHYQIDTMGSRTETAK